MPFAILPMPFTRMVEFGLEVAFKQLECPSSAFPDLKVKLRTEAMTLEVLLWTERVKEGRNIDYFFHWLAQRHVIGAYILLPLVDSTILSATGLKDKDSSLLSSCFLLLLLYTFTLKRWSFPHLQIRTDGLHLQMSPC